MKSLNLLFVALITAHTPELLSQPTTNIPPEIRMIHPSDGGTFTAPTNILLVAFTSDPEDKYFVPVEFFEGTNSIGFGTFNPTRCAFGCPNYILTWSNVPPGNYLISARATDSQGAVGVSPPIHITVTGPNSPPDTNTPIVTLIAADPIAVEGNFCRSNWWWTTSRDGTNWTVEPAVLEPVLSWLTNICSGTNFASFVVRRTGPTNEPLTVYYAIGGSASNGLDYATLPGNISIAAGRRSARIEVIPIEDSIPERIETVVLTLLRPPDATNRTPAYVPGFPHRAAAIIVDNDQPRPPCSTLPGGLFHLCRPATNGYNYSVQASADLVSWTALCTNIVKDGAVHYVDPGASDSTARFYRIVPEPLRGPEE